MTSKALGQEATQKMQLIKLITNLVRNYVFQHDLTYCFSGKRWPSQLNKTFSFPWEIVPCNSWPQANKSNFQT